jgi:hypothetical protein
MGKFWVHLLLSIAAILSYGLVGLPNAAKAENEPEPAGQTVTITEPNPIVQPTDWAYITLKLVAAKLNCPSTVTVNLTATYFLSNIQMTRYELAEVLLHCYNTVNQLLPTQEITKIISREDLAALQKIQEEFDSEFATVGKGLLALKTRIPIQPSDPIYKQLQLAIKDYDCAPATQNSNYDFANKELKPEEFVAILKGCLQRVNQLAASGTNKWTRSELEPLAKLESEFHYELYGW